MSAQTGQFKPSRGRQYCGDLPIRIDRGGQWYYHGSPIGRRELVKLFASVLSRDDAGDYWMTTPAEHGRIAVEDVPFIVVDMDREGSGADQVLRCRTNVDDEFSLDGDHPLYVTVDAETGEPSPYVTVRQGLDARLARAVYYRLVDWGVEEAIDGETHFGVWSHQHFFALGCLDQNP